MACSLHCLAQIYGSEVTSTDLLSVFDTFLKDIDEVKSGVISHIGEFLEVRINIFIYQIFKIFVFRFCLEIFV